MAKPWFKVQNEKKLGKYVLLELYDYLWKENYAVVSTKNNEVSVIDWSTSSTNANMQQ